MILANEIQQPAYAGMSDAEIAAALNAVSATTRRAVPLAEARHDGPRRARRDGAGAGAVERKRGCCAVVAGWRWRQLC